MKESIFETKKLIDNQLDRGKITMTGTAFSGYQKVYFSTNENIKEYLTLVNTNNKNKALTVLASGDHSFNLINKDILEIDTFDTNKLTEFYVFGIKKALVLKYNYKEYLNVISLLANTKTSFDTVNDILYGLLPFMDIKYREYWKSIIDYNYKNQKNNKHKLNLIELLYINITDSSLVNSYLINKEEYNKLKRNLLRTNITFNVVNASNLINVFNKKYDFILLSNILDYFNKIYGFNWTIDNLNEYIDRLHDITNENGIIFVNYIFNYYNSYYTRKNNLIQNSSINESDLNDYIIKKLEPSINQSNLKRGDGIILSKKKQ